ncbi:MAG: hypothetical protein RSD17_02030 [Oscillospiraceae bacterium]
MIASVIANISERITIKNVSNLSKIGATAASAKNAYHVLKCPFFRYISNEMTKTNTAAITQKDIYVHFPAHILTCDLFISFTTKNEYIKAKAKIIEKSDTSTQNTILYDLCKVIWYINKYVEIRRTKTIAGTNLLRFARVLASSAYINALYSAEFEGDLPILLIFLIW